MKCQNVREILIQRTVTVIATEGLDKTTTKAIVAGTGINEAYIYRHFDGKVDLLAKTFDALDSELASKVMQNCEVMNLPLLECEIRCRLFFTAIWEFLLSHQEKCLAYVRYYYSPYFRKYSADAHKQRYGVLVTHLSPAFREEANVWMILNHILNVMLDFAVKVFNREMPENDDYTEHVFRVIYASIRQYFKSKGEGCA